MKNSDWQNWHIRFRQALDTYKESSGEVDEDVATAAEVSRASITHWKKGIRTPQLRNFFLACEAIGADPAYILFGHSSRIANDLARRISNLPPAELKTIAVVLDGLEAKAAISATPKAINHQ